MKEAVFNLENPLTTDHMFYPQGVNLYLHTLTGVNGVMSIPLQVLTGNVVLSWNILMIILFVLSALATYALARRVTNNTLAAIVAGYIFTFSPFVMMRIHGHWNISTVWMLPVFAYFLVRYGENLRLRYAGAAGVVWALQTYNNPEYATDMALFLGLFLLYWSFVYFDESRDKSLFRLWRGVPLVLVAWLVVAGPLLVPALDEIRTNEISQAPGHDSQVTDPLALVTRSPLWGDGLFPSRVPDGSRHYPPGHMENTVYIGFTALALAAVAVFAIRSLRHPAVFWLIVFAVFTVLAFGSYLFIGDTRLFNVLGLEFRVPLPFQLYQELPVLEERRGIARLIVFAHLAVAVLAAIGIDAIGRALKGGRYKAFIPLVALLPLALVVLEYWSPPNAVARLDTPAIFEEIGREDGDFIVLHAPVGRSHWSLSGSQAGATMSPYFGFIHGKRTIGGYVSRAPDSTVFWLPGQPGIRYLACPACEGLPGPEDLDEDVVRELFQDLKVKYVAVHRLSPNGWQVGGPEIDEMGGYLEETLGMEQVYEEPAFTVYRNPLVDP
jgi:hypothetical protein